MLDADSHEVMTAEATARVKGVVGCSRALAARGTNSAAASWTNSLALPALADVLRANPDLVVPAKMGNAALFALKCAFVAQEDTSASRCALLAACDAVGIRKRCAPR